MCQQWENSFESFLADMGRCPEGMQLDRKDNDGNYEPGNCRWATKSTQARNKQNSLVFDGISLKEISEDRNINYYTLRKATMRGENPFTFAPKQT